MPATAVAEKAGKPAFPGIQAQHLRDRAAARRRSTGGKTGARMPREAALTGHAADGYSEATGHAITVAVGDGRGFNSLAAAPDGRAHALCTARSWPAVFSRSSKGASGSRQTQVLSRTRPRRPSLRKAFRACRASACCKLFSRFPLSPRPRWSATLLPRAMACQAIAKIGSGSV